MKAACALLVMILLTACSTTSTANSRDARIHSAAVETFGSSNFKTHEVFYSGPLSGALSSLGTSEELALAAILEKGSAEPLDLVVWSESSSKLASTLLRALRYPGLQRLPKLRLLFIGDEADANRARPAVEATGAKFFEKQI
jgi:hypothetical protein